MLKKLLSVVSALALAAGLTVAASAAAQASPGVIALPASCVSSQKAWFTEQGDASPTQASDGLLFSGTGATGPAVDWMQQVSGSLASVAGSSYTIVRSTGVGIASLVFEIWRDGVGQFATITVDDGAGFTSGTVTVTADTPVWTSAIAYADDGGQGHPITLSAMQAKFPSNALITRGIHLGSKFDTGWSTVVSKVTGCGEDATFLPQACVSTSGTWFTEDGDVPPTQDVDGLRFTGTGTSKPVDWMNPATGNLAGTVGSTYTIAHAVGYQTALVFEVNPNADLGNGQGVIHYATISIEPYLNGWTTDQTGELTVGHTTKVWTSKILSGPGSQGTPITLDQMNALMPNNTLLTRGLHLGSLYPTSSFTVVSGVTGCDRDASFVSFDPPTLAVLPASVTSTDQVCTSGRASGGTITVDSVQGTIEYFLDGSTTPIAGPTITVTPGRHTVTAQAVDPADTVDQASWPVTIAAATCPASLTTLAVTGIASPLPALLAAAALLLAGLALVGTRIRLRREV